MCFRKALLKAGGIESGQTGQVVGLSQRGNPKEPQIPIRSKPTSGKPGRGREFRVTSTSIFTLFD